MLKTQIDHQAPSYDQLPWEQTDFDVTVGQCFVSERNIAHARVLSDKQHTVSDGEVFLSYCSADQLPWEQTDFHVTVGQCFVSDEDSAGKFLPAALCPIVTSKSACRTTLPDNGSGF